MSLPLFTLFGEEALRYRLHDSGAAALKQLGKTPYNIVISDFNMDNGSGLDLLKAMRAHPVLKPLPDSALRR